MVLAESWAKAAATNGAAKRMEERILVVVYGVFGVDMWNGAAYVQNACTIDCMRDELRMSRGRQEGDGSQEVAGSYLFALQQEPGQGHSHSSYRL